MTGAEEAYFVELREPTPQPELLLGRRWEDMNSDRKRVLLIAQHDIFRWALALVLERHTDFKAVQVGSLSEAHQVLGDPDTEPDLAVVDLELPNDAGFGLIGEIHEAYPRTPVLALTTSRDLERTARAREAGAEEVLTMTASGEEILEEVRRLGYG
jgi:two-component system response regulator DevR